MLQSGRALRRRALQRPLCRITYVIFLFIILYILVNLIMIFTYKYKCAFATFYSFEHL